MPTKHDGGEIEHYAQKTNHGEEETKENFSIIPKNNLSKCIYGGFIGLILFGLGTTYVLSRQIGQDLVQLESVVTRTEQRSLRLESAINKAWPEVKKILPEDVINKEIYGE